MATMKKGKWRHLIPILIVILLLVECSYGISEGQLSSYLRGVFRDESGRELNQMVVSNESGTYFVYLGGMSRLYQLDVMDLTLLQQKDTADSCTDPRLCSTKILEVAPLPIGKLIQCGGVGGYCELRSLTDISRDVGYTVHGVVNNGMSVGVVAVTQEPDEYGLGLVFMYVATSIDSSSSIRFPITHRRLDHQSTPTFIFEYTDYINDITTADVDYIQGVSWKNYNFWIVHIGSEQSRLGRICSNTIQDDLAAYSEITLSCESQNILKSVHIDLNDVLYGVFTNGTNSVLCSFTMTKIQERFLDATCGCVISDDEGCIGRGQEMSYFDPDDSTCDPVTTSRQTRETLEENFQCDTLSRSTYVEATSPLVGNLLAADLPGEHSSVITLNKEDQTVALVTTSSTSVATLSKIHVEPNNTGRLYETVTFGEGGMVLHDVYINQESEELFILTNAEVMKLAVVNCSQYTTCSECNGPTNEDGDPFCGWCTLENKCSRSSECSNPNGDSSKWLQYNQDCIAINDLDPPSQEIDSPPEMVSFSVSQLPSLDGNSEYTCQFDGVPTSTSMNGNNFTCMTPAESARPPLPDGYDYVTMTLGIIASPTNVIIVEEEYPFFRCAAITSCTECVSSRWGCNWCIYSSTCTLNSATSCPDDDIVDNSDAASCPRLDDLFPEILIPVGLDRPIYLTGTNLPTRDGASAYRCVLSYVNDVSEFARVGVSDVTETSVECLSMAYDYPSSFGVELKFNIRVEYKSGVSLDNVDNTVTLFKCAVNELSCRSCVTTVVRAELGCGWCVDTCKVNETCNGDFLPRGESDSCPSPEITSIYPTAGPLEGNTTMTINGTNLAAEFYEIVNITVGGIPCSAIDENFVPGLSINCRTGSANNSLEGGVTVVFEFGTASGGNFIYRDPIVSGFTPFTGIRSGGTKMNISGEDLDTGRVIEVFVGNTPCTVMEESISPELLLCTTSESPETGNSSVIVSFDGTEKEVPGVYLYVDDPIIDDYTPKQSIMSGGIRMSVEGSGFSTVQSVQLELTSGEEVIYQECSKNTSELIYCLTPDLNNSTLGSTSRRRRQVTDIVGIAFILDGLRLDSNPEGLTVSPDPVYEVLEDAYVVKSLGELVTLRGTNLNVPDEAENFVTVCFGKGKCDVTTVTETELTCLSPENEPEGGVCKENNLDLPIDDNDINIVVFHGEAIGQYLGIASYDTGGSIVALIVGATVGGVVALSIIIFLVFVTIGHRNYRAQIKNTELEMQNLMQQSRREVMEGFFIDQEMTDIEEQLSGLGMPFVSNHDYMKSMLFFGLDVKPHESDPQNPSNEEEMAMLEFSKLLGNKDFLIIFIKALDSSRQITTKEKANIASLLTVVLVMERKFRYFTDVLMTLMSDTIGEAADRQRLKQLFKRTESLEDKMLNNWIALAMFQSIKETSGQPLYMLYQAIKIQCEKGPVDAMTGKSFFSLNFDNLLTESQDFEELTLNVESEIGQEPVKVLNVDTITQVKEKILDAMYRKKHTKYQRSAREVDLVLRSGNAGELVISDYDTSTQPSMGWCAINTLQHYGISSGTQVSLTNKTDMPNALPVPMNNDANNLFNDASRTSVRVAGHHDYHSHDLEKGPQDIRYYHLVQTEDIDEQDQEIDEGFCAKMQRTLCFKGTQGRRKIREIYLQRLVSVKQSINNFVDSALEAMFSIREDEYVNNLTNIPFALRFLFNFFDEESSRYEDDGTAATWKNNILPLRFWSTILAHPSFIFNMRQSRTADASVVVLNQMLDNACKGVVPTLKMNSSPSRLLFNKELPDHITLLTTYYHNIKQTPILQEAELKVECKRIDDEFTGLFSRLATLRQLYERIRPHETRLIEALQDDERCSQAHFASSLERVGNTLDQPED